MKHEYNAKDITLGDILDEILRDFEIVIVYSPHNINLIPYCSGISRRKELTKDILDRFNQSFMTKH